MKQAGRVESFQPHMHLRGKAMMMEAVLPSGQRQILSHGRQLQLQLAQQLHYADVRRRSLGRNRFHHHRLAAQMHVGWKLSTRPACFITKKPSVGLIVFGGMSMPPVPIRCSTWRYFGSWPFG